MRFNVDCEILLEISDKLKSKSDELNNLYQDLLTICDEINENYMSEDSTIYVEKFRNYIKTFINENEDLRNGGDLLNNISLSYSGKENKWKETIEKIENVRR